MDASVNRIALSRDERAILIALRIKGEAKNTVRYSLEELKLLVTTAGGIVVHTKTINRDRIDPAFIVGKGFVSKLEEIIKENEIRLIVFDINNIRPAQIRNLENILKCRVIGRNEVIIDIFAKRAKSAESKIQVELAQLKYLLPRLKGLGGVLSRLGGGIGTRGPGEKMLETDRRHIIKRITKLSRMHKKYQAHRERTRKFRKKELLGAVVGYTNAGKSSLINLLSRDDLFVENRLFATLDSYTRTVYLEDGKKTLLTDTVGFITNLPVNLLESFRSTLEEIKNADFIIHIIDLSSNSILNSIHTVENELNTLECYEKPTIMFFNKSDIIKDEKITNLVSVRYPDAITGSVKKCENIDVLKKRIIEIYNKIYSNRER